MTSATASRINVGTLRLSVCAFDPTNLGTNQGGEDEEPAEGVGDHLIGHIKAGLRLSLAAGIVTSGLRSRKADALHYKVPDTVMGEAAIDLRDARWVRRTHVCHNRRRLAHRLN